MEVKKFLSNRNILLDMASTVVHLLALMASTLRPLSSQLYNQQEKMQLRQLVNLMLDLGLGWTAQQDHETREIQFHLDPMLDTIVCFTPMSKLQSLGQPTKQLIARELDLERVRRSELLLNIRNTTNTNNQNSSVQLFTSLPINPNHVGLDKPNSLTKLKKDFFGRPIDDNVNNISADQNVSKDSIRDAKVLPILNQAVYFRFKEGYSNAVRRPVTIKEFL